MRPARRAAPAPPAARGQMGHPCRGEQAHRESVSSSAGTGRAFGPVADQGAGRRCRTRQRHAAGWLCSERRRPRRGGARGLQPPQAGDGMIPQPRPPRHGFRHRLRSLSRGHTGSDRMAQSSRDFARGRASSGQAPRHRPVGGQESRRRSPPGGHGIDAGVCRACPHGPVGASGCHRSPPCGRRNCREKPQAAGLQRAEAVEADESAGGRSG